MSDNATPAAVGSGDGLSLDHPERAAFARWCRENGHGELDDMLTPLDRSLRALMWPVWLGAVSAERERRAKLRSLLQGAELLFAPLCRDATAWNWLDEARAALAETDVAGKAPAR